MEKEIFEEKLAEALSNNFTKKIEEAVALIVDEKIKKLGLDKIDAKYGFGPGVEKEDLEKLSKEERVAKMIKAILRGDAYTARKIEATLKAVNESTDSEGGYLVPEEFTEEVLRIAGEYGLVRKYARVYPMKRNERVIPSLAGGVTAYWVNEAGAISSSHPTFSQLKLTAHKLAGISLITQEMLEDSPIDVVRLLQELFAEAIAYKEDYAGLRGDGSPITGVLNKSGVATVTMDSGDTTFDKIDADYLSELIDATSSVVQKSRNARFIMHPSLKHYLRTLKDSNGRYIFAEPGGAQPDTIWGYQVEYSEAMPGMSESGAGKAFVIFGDPTKFWVLGDRKKITVDIAKEATVGSDNLFEKDLQALKLVERIDIQVIPSLYGGDGNERKLVAILKTAAS